MLPICKADGSVVSIIFHPDAKDSPKWYGKDIGCALDLQRLAGMQDSAMARWLAERIQRAIDLAALARPEPWQPGGVLTITRCARCSKDHEGLQIYKLVGLQNPEFSHWATCPETGHPIMIRFEGER